MEAYYVHHIKKRNYSGMSLRGGFTPVPRKGAPKQSPFQADNKKPMRLIQEEIASQSLATTYFLPGLSSYEKQSKRDVMYPLDMAIFRVFCAVARHKIP